MADKIKRFFSKKKADVKFKKAGPGNKLSSEGSHSASSSHNPPDYEVPSNTPMTEERKLAAHAALLRLEQKKVNPNFNTSLSAIQVSVTLYLWVMHFKLDYLRFYNMTFPQKKNHKN